MTGTAKIIWRRISATLAVCSLLSIVFWYCTMTYYYQVLPRKADTTTGQIIPYNYHGLIIYESTREHLFALAFLIGSGVLFCAAATIGVFILKLPLIRDAKRQSFYR